MTARRRTTARAQPTRTKRGSFVGLFTIESWREFKRHGGIVMGFTDKKWKAAVRLRPGDRILCYLSKVSAFVGVLTVTGAAYRDNAPIWTDGVFPVRIPVTISLERTLTEAIPIRSLADSLSFMKGRDRSSGWTIFVRSSPRPWSDDDAGVVIKALKSRPRGPVDDVANKASHSVSEARAPRLLNRNPYPVSLRVGRLVEKTRSLEREETPECLGSYDRVLSYNKVTGHSVNVPIALTCRPTAVCLKTCYFATGAPSWAHSLRHQRKVYETIRADPEAFAERVALEYDRLHLTFLRWNGGGDLFQENVQAINYLARSRPDVVLWVVTRIPEMAALVEHRPNVFVHFSLDKNSLNRRKAFLSQPPKSKNIFFSYQCDAGEVPTNKTLEGVSVLFFDNYEATTDIRAYDADIVCPLNTLKNIEGACEGCRRCFNGEAVQHHALMQGRQ
jgi:hypothetical protein